MTSQNLSPSTEPKLYSELASWWPLLSSPVDYAEEAALFRDILNEACAPKTILELGSGGGNNASHLKADFEMTLVDRSPGMIDVSRELNPECEHRLGDMRNIRLGKLYDAVFVHDAIMYLTSEDDLAAAIETAFVHCRPGGAALLVPDCFRETFSPYTKTGGHDGPDRSLRYLEWNFDPDPGDDTFTCDFTYLLRSGRGQVEAVYDRHLFGLFDRSIWLDLCRRRGFEPELRDGAEDPTEMILCRKPMRPIGC